MHKEVPTYQLGHSCKLIPVVLSMAFQKERPLEFCHGKQINLKSTV
jgi:hypothetical protein